MAKQTTASTARLKQLYQDKLAQELKAELKLDNIHEVPRLTKIIVSSGIGKKKDDKRYHEVVSNTLAKITGQKPVDRMAKKSIATFKIRAGMNRVGVSVTLRDKRMYEFLDRFINTVLPRVRDFHGVKPGAFDAQGNYSVGIVEQSVFPELTFEEAQILHGLQVTFVIDSRSAEDSRALLEAFGMPFEKETKKGANR